MLTRLNLIMSILSITYMLLRASSYQQQIETCNNFEHEKQNKKCDPRK